MNKTYIRIKTPLNLLCVVLFAISSALAFMDPERKINGIVYAVCSILWLLVTFIDLKTYRTWCKTESLKD